MSAANWWDTARRVLPSEHPTTKSLVQFFDQFEDSPIRAGNWKLKAPQDQKPKDNPHNPQ